MRWMLSRRSHVTKLNSTIERKRNRQGKRKRGF